MAESKGYIKNSDVIGSINISEDVIVVIAAAAAAEVEGVHSLYFASTREFTSILSKKGGMSRGVKLAIDGDDVSIDIFVITEMGHSVSDVGAEIQKSVTSAVESAVGVTVRAVNVHICGISLKKKSK